MADANTTSTAQAIFLGELTIKLDSKWSTAEYIGTRTQLEAEGVIPPQTKWPDGFNSVFWTVAGVRFWLRRERPEGARGPRKAFLDCDNWCLRMDPENIDCANQAIKLKAKELAELTYRQSAKGRAEWDRSWKLFWKAQEDDKFQAFKNLLGLNPPPRRGRHSRSTAKG